MRTTLCALLPILLLLSVLPSATAKAEPQFFETAVVEDPDGDYEADGSLDLVGVHIAEKFQYNSDQQTGAEVITIRFQVKNIGSIRCGAEVRYDLFYKVGGTPKSVFASHTTEPPTNTQAACQPKVAAGSGTVSLRAAQNSLVLIVSRETLAAPVGALLSDMYATSSLVTPVQAVGQDVAPADNANSPSATAPTTGLKSYVMVGTYPFIDVVPVDGLEQYSVGGAEVEYNFQFFSHPELRDDSIRVRFAFPEGWTIAPSQGRTGADPEGQLTGGNDGAPRDFSFTLSSSGAAAEGDAVSVVMEVITDSGGHVNVTTVTTVSGAKIVDPSLDVKLLTPGPFKAEADNAVRFALADPGGPLVGAGVSVDLLQNGKRVSTTPLTGGPDGTYQGMVRFPGEGTFTLDAYVSSLKPSPHQEFVVKAEKGGLAPAAPLWSALAALVGVLAWRRRA